jgi:hypothetical protein
MLDDAWKQVQDGQQVTVTPRGHSMKGIVPDRAEVDVCPCDPGRLEAGDVVLVKVNGRVYLHKVLAVDHRRQRALIGNNRGGTNGWTSWRQVAGIAVRVNGLDRRDAQSKVRQG